MPFILVIEDDKNLNKGIIFALEKENYQMFSAETLQEAGEILAKQPVDLILLDLNLPDGDGMDFCCSLRKRSQIPVIMLTARDLETDEVQGLECGWAVFSGIRKKENFIRRTKNWSLQERSGSF